MPIAPSAPPSGGPRRPILSARAGFLAAALGALALALASGCDSDTPNTPSVPVPLDSIDISSPAETLLVGATIQFGFAAFDTNGAAVPSPSLNWFSSDPQVAAVDSRGRVTGLSEGTAEIHATGGGATSDTVAQLVVQGFGWVTQFTPTVGNLRGVHFVDRQTGWAVGELGLILSTPNAGLDWSQQQSNSTGYRLNAVHFVSASHGFVVGSAGRLLETVDAGDDWDPVTVDASGQELNDIYFADDLRGFIVGSGGVILRTSDGGASWTRYLPSVTTTNLRSVWAVDVADTLRAWAVGDLGTIVGTMNGGDLWTIFTPGVTTDPLQAVVRRSVDEAMAAGLNNRVAFTSPGPAGPEWSLAPAPFEFSSFYGLAWPVAGRAYATGINNLSNAVIQVSTDGGVNWTPQFLPGDAPLAGNELHDVWFVDGEYGWAVGRGGLILHTATGGF